MSCVSRIATVTAWLDARLAERGYDAARAAEILADSTFVSAGTTIYVDFHEPPEARPLSFVFAGGEISHVSGFTDPGAPTPGEPRSRASV